MCACFVGIILYVLDSGSGNVLNMSAWGKQRLEKEKKEEAKKKKRRRRFLLWVRAILVGPPTWKCLLKEQDSLQIWGLRCEGKFHVTMNTNLYLKYTHT